MIPTQMNCSHSGDGWCLQCVKTLADERDSYLTRMLELQRTVNSIEELLSIKPKYPVYEFTFNAVTD